MCIRPPWGPKPPTHQLRRSHFLKARLHQHPTHPNTTVMDQFQGLRTIPSKQKESCRVYRSCRRGRKFQLRGQNNRRIWTHIRLKFPWHKEMQALLSGQTYQNGRTICVGTQEAPNREVKRPDVWSFERGLRGDVFWLKQDSLRCAHGERVLSEPRVRLSSLHDMCCLAQFWMAHFARTLKWERTSRQPWHTYQITTLQWPWAIT